MIQSGIEKWGGGCKSSKRGRPSADGTELTGGMARKQEVRKPALLDDEGEPRAHNLESEYKSLIYS
jgi:hypothetical protein